MHTELMKSYLNILEGKAPAVSESQDENFSRKFTHPYAVELFHKIASGEIKEMEFIDYLTALRKSGWNDGYQVGLKDGHNTQRVIQHLG